VFVDESGVRTNLTRLYGRAPKGERVREAVPHGHWQVLTILGALTTNGVQASMTDTAPSGRLAATSPRGHDHRSSDGH
jgi:hypothetical protein